MRPVLVIIIALVILGGVKSFIDSDRPAAPIDHSQMITAASTANYDVELAFTFDAGPDDFSIDDDAGALSLLVQLNGQEILRRTDAVSVSESPLLLPEIKGVFAGANEFFVQAIPSGGSFEPCALRIRVLRDDRTLAEETIWSETGGIVQGTATLEVSE